MNKTTIRKSKSLDESIINWCALSKLLTGKSVNMRQNRIPSKHKKEVEQLIYYIECWKQQKILISPDDFKEKISKIDLLSVIMDEK